MFGNFIQFQIKTVTEILGWEKHTVYKIKSSCNVQYYCTKDHEKDRYSTKLTFLIKKYISLINNTKI